VLVRGNRIAAIGPLVQAAPGATVVAGDGRTLMPGLIDAHWHTILIRPTPERAIFGDVGFTNLTVTSRRGMAISACRPNRRATHRGRCRGWNRSTVRWWRTRRTPCGNGCANS
jgi:imidazolonepropionase-like amidohydrolase